MSLQDLPPELTERVVVLLPLSDISSLRLTNKRLALETAQKHLKASFRTKRVQLTEERLRSFAAVTASGGLGCLLQDLTLVAPVYNTLELTTRLEKKSAKFAEHDKDGNFTGLGLRHLTKEEMEQSRLDLAVLEARLAEQLDMLRNQRDVALLGQAFSNLAANGASLRILRVEVEIYKDDATTPLLPLFGGSLEPIWTTVASANHTLFASLTTCNLPIQTLDLFNSSRMLRCSLSYEEFSIVDFASGRLDCSLSHLTELSLSISGRIIDQSSNHEFPEAISEPNVNGLRVLLRSCPNIQKLDLAYFSLKYVDDDLNVQGGRLLRLLAESSLPCLQDLTLQGFQATENELLMCLQSFKGLRSLSLRCIKLLTGSFKPILDYCTMEAAMEEVELESLFEARIVQFEPPWVIRPSQFPPVGFPDSCASYRRPSADAGACRIKHHMRQGRTLDAPYIKAWGQDMINRFGPLNKNGKPSCLQPYVRPERTWRYR